jgi:hypothetical protein
MGYTDKYVQVPVIEFQSTEEVENEDGTTSLRGACTTYHSYINPFDIVRFESHSYSPNITAVYTRYGNVMAIDMRCDEFMSMIDSHVARS